MAASMLSSVSKAFDGGAETGAVNDPDAASRAGHFERMAFDTS